MAVELTIQAPKQTRVFYEVYGEGEPTVLLLPTWSIIHSRHWKMQIPHLARQCRVVTFDGRGNDKSDRPAEAAAYAILFGRKTYELRQLTASASAANSRSSIRSDRDDRPK